MPDLVIPWQARFLRGLRKPDVRTAALSVARSNGKSWLAAKLAADYLTDGAPDSECVIVASSYTQATVIFHYVTALALNLGTSDRPESVLLDPADWERCETDLPPARDGAFILAFDMGGASAMTAAAGFWPATGRAEVMAVIGGVPSLAERGRTDNVGPLYRKMADRRELLVSEGRRTPNVEGFIEAVIERYGVPGAIVADRYKEAELYDALNGARVPARPVTLRGMGWRDGAEDVRRFRAAVFEGKVRAPKSLLLRSALAEARVMRDTAGNEKLAKGSQSGRRALARDDAAAALILAVAEGVRRGVPDERRGLRLVAV